MNTTQPPSAIVPLSPRPTAAVLRQAVASHLARYTGQTRTHTESDLRAFLTWCSGRELDPLNAHRVHVELYVRRMQEVRRYKAATISRSVRGHRVLPHRRHRRRPDLRPEGLRQRRQDRPRPATPGR